MSGSVYGYEKLEIKSNSLKSKSIIFIILSATSCWEYISERRKPLGFWGPQTTSHWPLVPSTYCARRPFSVLAPVKFRPVSAPEIPLYCLCITTILPRYQMPVLPWFQKIHYLLRYSWENLHFKVIWLRLIFIQLSIHIHAQTATESCNDKNTFSNCRVRILWKDTETLCMVVKPCHLSCTLSPLFSE